MLTKEGTPLFRHGRRVQRQAMTHGSRAFQSRRRWRGARSWRGGRRCAPCRRRTPRLPDNPGLRGPITFSMSHEQEEHHIPSTWQGRYPRHPAARRGGPDKAGDGGDADREASGYAAGADGVAHPVVPAGAGTRVPRLHDERLGRTERERRLRGIAATLTGAGFDVRGAESDPWGTPAWPARAALR